MTYKKDIEQVLKDTDSSINGLTSSDAEQRLKAEGYNELTEGKRHLYGKCF